MMERGPFTVRRDGSLDARLSDVESQALRRVAAELAGALADPDERELKRLFPPAYTDDTQRQDEFAQMTRSDLVRRKVEAARAVLGSLDAGTRRRGTWRGVLDLDAAHAWLAVLNDARLVLGTRLDVREDMDYDEIGPDDPRAPLLNLYVYLSGLEELLVDALAALELGEDADPL